MSDPIRHKYNCQKTHAKIRGIEWHFTFEEWVAWWGDDFINRGRTKGKLVMARIGDQGPYHPDNVVKITNIDNSKEANIGRIQTAEQRAKNSTSNTGRKHSEETRKLISKSNTGKKKSAEHRANLSRSKKEMWAKRKEQHV
jgi:hypothetical protein